MTLRVLVVDDNKALAENVGEILEAEGYDVWVTDDPREAVRLANEHEVDAAILDVRMPVMDGVTLCGLLTEERPCMSCILMTAYSRDERIEQALAFGVRAVLPKPVPVDRLLAELPQAGAEEVLLVEDDRALGAALAEALEEHGYRTRCASTIAAAKRSIDVRRPSAVVTDLRLPDGDGLSFVSELRSSGDLPVVLITAFDTDEAEGVIAAQYGKRGRLLSKPFPTEALLDALRDVGKKDE